MRSKLSGSKSQNRKRGAEWGLGDLLGESGVQGGHSASGEYNRSETRVEVPCSQSSARAISPPPWAFSPCQLVVVTLVCGLYPS